MKIEYFIIYIDDEGHHVCGSYYTKEDAQKGAQMVANLKGTLVFVIPEDGVFIPKLT
jgi:hypothetical protein